MLPVPKYILTILGVEHGASIALSRLMSVNFSILINQSMWIGVSYETSRTGSNGFTHLCMYSLPSSHQSVHHLVLRREHDANTRCALSFSSRCRCQVDQKIQRRL